MSEISELRERLATLTMERREQARLDIIRLLTTDRWVTKPRRGLHPTPGGLPVTVEGYTDGIVTYVNAVGARLLADLDEFIRLHKCPGLTEDVWMDYYWSPR